MNLENCAVRFDAPISSDKHAELRDTAWMGLDLIEGRYLLGRLLHQNFFRATNEEYHSSLQEYFLGLVGKRAASVLSTSAPNLGVLFLRWQCRKISDIKFVGRLREAKAIYLLAMDPKLADVQLAAELKTTVKQIERLASVSYFRRLISRTPEAG